MLQRPFGLLGDVDLAVLEARDEVFGRQIDQLDGVGAVEDRIGNRLANAHLRDLGDDVVQAFDVLDVDGGIDVDAVVQDLLHVEVALGMTAAGRVGVGKLVDKHDLRPAGENGVDVHLLEPSPLVLHASARDDLEALEQGLASPSCHGFRRPRRRCRSRPSCGRGRSAAFRRSCRRRGRRRQKCEACRRGFPRAGLPPARLRAKVACRDRVVLRASRLDITGIFAKKHCARLPPARALPGHLLGPSRAGRARD